MRILLLLFVVMFSFCCFGCAKKPTEKDTVVLVEQSAENDTESNPADKNTSVDNDEDTLPQEQHKNSEDENKFVDTENNTESNPADKNTSVNNDEDTLPQEQHKNSEDENKFVDTENNTESNPADKNTSVNNDENSLPQEQSEKVKNPFEDISLADFTKIRLFSRQDRRWFDGYISDPQQMKDILNYIKSFEVVSFRTEDSYRIGQSRGIDFYKGNERVFIFSYTLTDDGNTDIEIRRFNNDRGWEYLHYVVSGDVFAPVTEYMTANEREL